MTATPDTGAVLPMNLLQTLHVAEHPEGRPPFISSGSSLELCGDWMYVAVDDEFHVGVFPRVVGGVGRLARVLPGALPADPAERKASKPDLETVCMLGPGSGGSHRQPLLLGIPSGSTDHRMTGFAQPLDLSGMLDATPRALDCSALFAAVDREFGNEINVEGAAATGDEFLLFLRSTAGQNHVAALSLDAVVEDVAGCVLSARALERIDPCDLGELDGTPLGFSDAAVVGDRIVFTASAEATDNAYDDGAVIGSVIGTLGAGCTAHHVHRLAAVEKVEGLAIVDQIGSEFVLWLVTDDDEPGKPSRLYETRMPA